MSRFLQSKQVIIKKRTRSNPSILTLCHFRRIQFYYIFAFVWRFKWNVYSGVSFLSKFLFYFYSNLLDAAMQTRWPEYSKQNMFSMIITKLSVLVLLFEVHTLASRWNLPKSYMIVSNNHNGFSNKYFSLKLILTRWFFQFIRIHLGFEPKILSFKLFAQKKFIVVISAPQPQNEWVKYILVDSALFSFELNAICPCRFLVTPSVEILHQVFSTPPKMVSKNP